MRPIAGIAARGAPSAIALVVALVWPATAGGWTYEGAKWPMYRLPLEYSVGPACRELGDEDTVAVVNRAFQQWEDVDCAYVSFEYIGRGSDLGLSQGGYGRPGDGHNNISWCTDCLGGNALGVSVVQPSGRGTLGECDEYMEDSYTYTLDHDLGERGVAIDAEGVVVHECGHCIGLGHTDVARATMYPVLTPGWEMYTLDPDDIEGVCSIYPMEQGCEEDDECREGTSCVEGSCVPLPPVPRGFGFPCTEPSDCVSGVCVVDPGTEESICSEECDLLSPACPEDAACRRFGPCTEAFCVWSMPGSREPGDECGSDADCRSGLCDEAPEGFACALPCDPGVALCPEGTWCWDTGDDCGACRPQEPEGGILGTPCRNDDDCEFGVCAHVGEDRLCTEECESGDDCPDGFVCANVGSIAICIPEGGLLGDDCSGNGDCGSRVCAHLGDDSYCTRYCDEIDCPEGWECVDASGYLICTRKQADDDGCGCRSAGGGAPGPGLAAAGLAALLVARRRRR